MSKSVRNATAGILFLEDVGIPIQSAETYILNEGEYPLWSAAVTEGPDSQLTTLVKNGDLVVSDGTTDLIAEVGLIHLKTGIRIIQSTLTDQVPGVLEDKILSGTGVSITEIGTTNKQLRRSAVTSEFGQYNNVIYVGNNGSDTTGDGTFYKPYASVKFAMSVITDNSTDNRYLIRTGPGVYLEDNPITIKPFVMIEGVGKGLVKIKPLNDDVMFNVTYFSRLQNLLIVGDGRTSQVGVYHGVAGALAILWDVIFIDIYTGLHLNANGLMVFYNAELFTSTHGINTGIRVSAGGIQVTSYSCTTTPGAGVNTAIRIDGANQVTNISNIKFDTADLTTGVYITNGGQAAVSSFVMNGVTTGFDVDNGTLSLSSGRVVGQLGARLNNGAVIETAGADFHECTINAQLLDAASGIFMSGGEASRDRIINVPGAGGSAAYFLDRKLGDEGLAVYAELAVGRPDRGYESVFGEGDSYTIGMNIITTDNTCTSTTDGGNYIDVSANASEIDGTHFSFQGTTANHCIYITSDVSNGTDYVRFFGLKVLQVVAAVEVTRKSFAFEYWDGAAWVEDTVMASEANNYYLYANEVFIRANSSEHIRFGRALSGTSSKKTVNGKERYWMRIRIKSNLTTAPTFEQVKLSSSRTELNTDGTCTMHGKSRFVEALSFQSNTFGETGGVTDSSITIGSGTVPAGWTHVMKNNRMNGNKDALYSMSAFPDGICTASGIDLDIKYIPLQTGSSSNGEMKISFLPIEVIGSLVADLAGGITPVPRSAVNTESITAKPAQTQTISVPLAEGTKIQSISATGFDISDYYEGDMMFFRVEYSNDGDANKDVALLGIDVKGIKWRLGGRSTDV